MGIDAGCSARIMWVSPVLFTKRIVPWKVSVRVSARYVARVTRIVDKTVTSKEKLIAAPETRRATVA